MKPKTMSRICAVTILIILLFSVLSHAASRQLTTIEIKALTDIYAPDGYERTHLKQLFSDSRVRYVPKLVRMLVVPPDFSANYERFTKKDEIESARAFRRYWRTRLGEAATMHGVDRDVIVAILLVETSLGKNLGRSPVLSVFASLLLESSLHRDAFIKKLEDNSQKGRYIKRLDEKAFWAREELRSLMTMHQKKAIDVCGIRGSYAGAFGIPQFLPSSYLKWAHSGNEKQPANLFYMPHAFMSVANFLKEHGWKNDLTQEEKRAVIWNYNRSSTYVDTVLTIAEKLNKNPHHR
jgi:membrane-bound lytic murein transglycosylase B